MGLKIRAHIWIFGIVQGVFFRSQTRKEANRYEVFGWVKNLREGGVEAVFEGDEASVHKLIEFCKIGPFRARVNRTKVLMEDFTGEFLDFQIRW